MPHDLNSSIILFHNSFIVRTFVRLWYFNSLTFKYFHFKYVLFWFITLFYAWSEYKWNFNYSIVGSNMSILGNCFIFSMEYWIFYSIKVQQFTAINYKKAITYIQISERVHILVQSNIIMVYISHRKTITSS